MIENSIDILTADGKADGVTLHPDGTGPWPGVILYMDAFGVRPDLIGMGRRLASNGYYVLLPNLFYRISPKLTFSPSAFEGPERDRIMGLIFSLTNEMVMRDTRAYLEFLRGQPACNATKIGCVGYCMGGPLALTAAATYPETVVAAASIHGGRLATDRPDSPHLLAPRMKGKIYVGIAGIDPFFTVEEKERLENALKSAPVRYMMEVFPGVKHGFAVTGHPVFNPAASEIHWQRLVELFRAALQ